MTPTSPLASTTNATVTDAAWDYTRLAHAYADRPNYADRAIDTVLEMSGTHPGDLVCDIGAGSGHLTLPLLARGLTVDAVEPNAAMRELGSERTAHRDHVVWHEGTAAHTGRPSGRYKLVTFGSSFNVADPTLTLPETARLLAEGGWFVCLWNHRDLADPLQAEIEQLIARHVPNYSYGDRRADQSTVIESSGLFGPVHPLESEVVHRVDTKTWCAAWHSHATLARQAGTRFTTVVDAIGELVHARAGSELEIPYVTRGWLARVLPKADQP